MANEISESVNIENDENSSIKISGGAKAWQAMAYQPARGKLRHGMKSQRTKPGVTLKAAAEKRKRQRMAASWRRRKQLASARNSAAQISLKRCRYLSHRQAEMAKLWPGLQQCKLSAE